LFGGADLSRMKNPSVKIVLVTWSRSNFHHDLLPLYRLGENGFPELSPAATSDDAVRNSLAMPAVPPMIFFSAFSGLLFATPKIAGLALA